MGEATYLNSEYAEELILSMFSEHMSPKYTFNINFTSVKCSVETPGTQTGQTPNMGRELEYSTRVEICNIATRSVNTKSMFSKRNCLSMK